MRYKYNYPRDPKEEVPTKPWKWQHLVIVGVVFIVFSLYIIRGYYWSERAANWPKANGVITGIEIRPLGAQGNHHQVLIWYDYTVKNVVLKGDSFNNLQNRIGGNDDAERVKKKFQKSGPCTVFYNPENHEESYLEVFHSDDLFYIGIEVMVIGCCWLLAGYLKYKRRPIQEPNAI